MFQLVPSILSADFTFLGENVQKTLKSGVKYIHFDVMDGHFVDNITIGPLVLKSLSAKVQALYDVHLMISNPLKYLNEFIVLKPEIITVHFESDGDTSAQLKMIRDAGIKAGVSIKPNTPVSDILHLMNEVDLVLVMSVEPGFGGQGFIPSSIDKIRELSQFIKQNNLKILIEVDGGVKEDNIADVAKAGANLLVAGSAVFNGDIESNTKKLIEKISDI